MKGALNIDKMTEKRRYNSLCVLLVFLSTFPASTLSFNQRSLQCVQQQRRESHLLLTRQQQFFSSSSFSYMATSSSPHLRLHSHGTAPAPATLPAPFPDRPKLPRLIRLLLLPFIAVATFFSKPASVFASSVASFKSSAPKGWDLYGRIPYDDWLFNNWVLTDPNLLKRSFVEAITDEIPDVLLHMNRKRRINEVAQVVSGFGVFAVGIVVVTVMYRAAMASYRQRVQREDMMRGYKLPTSAVSKKAPKKGKQIEGQDDGWIDMESEVEDDTDTDSGTRRGKNKKIKDDDNDDDDDDDDDDGADE